MNLLCGLCCDLVLLVILVFVAGVAGRVGCFVMYCGFGLWLLTAGWVWFDLLLFCWWCCGFV